MKILDLRATSEKEGISAAISTLKNGGKANHFLLPFPINQWQKYMLS